jgi:predicted porin
MKKTLVALAALAATSAFAQSSVSLTGRLDVGQQTVATGSLAANPTVTTAKTITWNADQTSFYRLSGSEDMGGGMKANFLIEQKIEGSKDQFSDVTDGARGAYIEVVDAKMGGLRAGFMNTGARDVFAGFSQSKATNVIGELASSTAASSASGAADINAGSHAPFATAIKYTTPTFAGVTLAGSVTQNESKAGTATKVNTAQGYSYGGNYANGPLAAAVSYSNSRTNITTVLPALTSGSYSLNLVAGDTYDLTVKQTAAAVKYTFANVTASYIYMKTTQVNDLSTTKANYNRNSGTLGVSAVYGNYTPFATLSTGTLNADSATAGVADKDQTLKGRQAGVRYALSKRTNAYAIYGSAERNAADNTKATIRQTSFGLTHLF